MKRLTSSPARYLAIAAALRLRIRRGLQAGDRLPSIRDLAREHDVSLGTVQQAMASLMQEGLIAPQPRRGYVVALPASNSHPPRLGLAILDQDRRPQDLAARLHLLLGALDQSQPTSLSLWTGTSAQFDALLEWTAHLHGVLLWGKVNRQQVSRLHENGKAVVVIDSLPADSCPPGVGCVFHPLAQDLRLAITHLHALGHRHILLLSKRSVTRKRSQPELAMDAQARAFSNCHIHHLPLTPDQRATNHILKAWKRLKNRPTAIIAQGKRLAIPTHEALVQLDLKIPRDVSLLALAHHDAPPHGPAAFTCVEPPAQAMMRTAMAMLGQMLRGQPPTRHEFQPLLVAGDTTGPAPHPH